MAINATEYGQVIRFNIGQNVSAGTAFKITLQPKAGAAVEQTTGITVGSVNVTEGDTVFTANEYLEYTTVVDDIPVSGRYRKRGQATLSSTVEVLGNYERFTVLT